MRIHFATMASFSTLFFYLLFSLLPYAKADLIKALPLKKKEEKTILVLSNAATLAKTENYEQKAEQWDISSEIQFFEFSPNEKTDSLQKQAELNSKQKEVNYELILSSNSLTLEKVVEQTLEEENFEIGENIELKNESEIKSEKEEGAKEEDKGDKNSNEEEQNFEISVLYLMPSIFCACFIRFLLISIF